MNKNYVNSRKQFIRAKEAVELSTMINDTDKSLPTTFNLEDLNPLKVMENARRVAIFLSNSRYNNGFIRRRINEEELQDLEGDALTLIYENYDKLKDTDLTITVHPFIVQSVRHSLHQLSNYIEKQSVNVTSEQMQVLEAKGVANILYTNEYYTVDRLYKQAYEYTYKNAQQRTQDTLLSIAVNIATHTAQSARERNTLKRFKANVLTTYEHMLTALTEDTE